MIARPQLSQPVLRAAPQSSPQQIQQPAPSPPQAVPAQSGSQQIAPPTPAHVGPVIVLDPAHGGIDNGARGQGGVVEKDLVLLFARTARLALEREGF
ncbi:MAG: N-acetylmuramoyl-L-alanine amidase, partial [Candidatus Acidiferrales bacterium]